MIAGQAFLDAFVNANILFCVAFCLWRLVQTALTQAGLRDTHAAQLQLLNAAFLAIVCAPLVVLIISALQGWGLASEVNVNLSDMVVSYYLSGGLEMKASEFEKLILLRENLTLNVLRGAGLFAMLAIVAFGAGCLLGFVRLFFSIFCLWRIVAQSFAWRSIGRIRIHLSDQTLVPFSTRGLRNYYVVIPSQMLARPHELKVTCAHEFQHIRQGDLEWEVLLEALKPVFFLNPAYHAWKRQVEHLREFVCDTAVLSAGQIDRRAYCDTLLSVSQRTLRRAPAFVSAVPKVTLVTADRRPRSTGTTSFLEHRIRSVLRTRKPGHQRLLSIGLGIPLMMTVTVVSLALQRPGDWSQDRLMLSTVVNLERLDEINSRSSFGRAGH